MLAGVSAAVAAIRVDWHPGVVSRHVGIYLFFVTDSLGSTQRFPGLGDNGVKGGGVGDGDFA